ncbi:flagellar L-ring protein precursor FlgH [Caminibacter pacificus]|uniref:Flagellar L-ring protein n=2 Tax=Caminibacter pacificus TaxID=1424653 RepID=A0AAJ4RE71_9BACT|nr:flagellar basal body L-ring protein FlgH [Caminibacter pacificus]ROR41083.1 flagellar L-ring protein precursor FlgH [Caminibacter pacificus]
MKTLTAVAIAGGMLFIGCASHPMDPTISMTPPKYVQEMPSKDTDNVSNNPGSLFSNGTNLFSDTKAKRVNDVVTVVITEQITQSSQASKKLNESNTDAGGLFDATISGGAYVGGKEYKLSKTGIGINFPSMNSTRTFQGSGTQQRNEKFQTTITARIVKVLANGNYYIYGTRELYVDGQKQIIQISGVVRPEDISPDNTIDSKYIADAKIAYKTQGDIKRYTEQNWFAKLWSAIVPW